MAIKGGSLDCEGQMEIEENLNRLQERYGSYELGEKFVCENFGGTYIITSEDVGNDYIEGNDRLNLSEIRSDAEHPCVTTIVINGADCKSLIFLRKSQKKSKVRETMQNVLCDLKISTTTALQRIWK